MVLAMVGLMTACRDNPLAVNNTDNPNVSQVFALPVNVESLISKLYQQMYNGQYGASDDIWTQAMTMSMESHSQLGNFGMGTRAAIPRSPIDNSIGNTVATGNFRDFDFLSRNERSAANGIAAVNKYLAQGFTAGSVARDARAKSFAYFSLGYAMGQLAMLYDSAAIITQNTAIEEVPPLSASKAVVAAALTALDSALAIANSADATNGAGGWPIPPDWVSSPNASGPDLATWKQIIRSFKARYRAGIARTPAERAAVDWNAVVADATNGITSDFIILASVTGGWNSAPIQQLRVSSGWSQMTPMILGMADTTGNYDAWLATPISTRSAFLMKTPDKRFPSGETRALQTAVTGTNKGGPAPGSILYFRNRPEGEDTPAEPWGTWYYDNWRFWAIGATSGNGPFVVMSVTESDMLAAEGYLRNNQFAQAAALIDKTRIRSGLPSVAGITSATQVVPGGSACVPRVPQPPNYTSTACGTIFEAMKWEKRVETSFTGYSQWFIDARGWGDLVQGTALEWPVPYQEIFARFGPTYTTSAKAAKGTYGF